MFPFFGLSILDQYILILFLHQKSGKCQKITACNFFLQSFSLLSQRGEEVEGAYQDVIWTQKNSEPEVDRQKRFSKPLSLRYSILPRERECGGNFFPFPFCFFFSGWRFKPSFWEEPENEIIYLTSELYPISVFLFQISSWKWKQTTSFFSAPNWPKIFISVSAVPL